LHSSSWFSLVKLRVPLQLGKAESNYLPAPKHCAGGTKEVFNADIVLPVRAMEKRKP
jgi:hypothetical protein